MKIVSFDLLSVIFCLLVLRQSARQSAGTSADGISDASYKTAQAGDLSLIITESLFNEMLKHRGDAKCRGAFYRYSSFLTAARSFSGFGTTGDNVTRKREIAAFFAQTSYQTSGGWSDAPDGPYAWGYCLLQEHGNPSGTIFCSGTKQWPCATGKKYYGRGPFMISWNHNYGPAGKAIGVDLLNNPDLVTSDPVISFKTALWYWMTPQVPKPSSHDVITEQWTPSPADRAAKRLPGYGVITNIINGVLECGRDNSESSQSESRIGFYRRYCTILGVTPGENLGCANQKSF